MRFIHFLVLLFPFSALAQVTIESNTLPDIGDSLEYLTITNMNLNTSYKDEGENQVWIYNDLKGNITFKEYYRDIRLTDLSDTFPDANMLVDFLGFRSAAIRSTNKIDIIGFEFGGIDGFGFSLNPVLERPFTLRTTPINYGDRFDDNFEVVIGISPDLIPGLDSIMIPGGGGNAIDSIRITTNILKDEKANGWGTLTVNSRSFDVLKIEQTDSTSTKIEVGLPVFGQLIWLDATGFLGDFVSNFNRSSTTYKFLTPDSKRSLLEFRESFQIDTSGNNITLTTIQMSNEIMTSVENDVFTRLDVFPNPTNETLYFSDIINGILTIVNTSGIEVLKESFNNDQLNVSSLKSGAYILYIDELNGDRKISKFIKQ